MQARYYDSVTGRFVSQDPAFIDFGDSSGFNERYGRSLEQHLQNPQALNSYAYGLNNPVTFRDPQGEIVPLIILGAWAAVEFGLSAYDAYSTYQTLASTDSNSLEKAATLGGFAAGLALPGGGYGTVGKSIVKTVDKAVDATKTTGRSYTVYHSIKEGVEEYVGHTVDFVRRQQEHFRNGRSVEKIKGLTNLPEKNIAKGVEQVLIEKFGFSKNGGSLSNKINSISPTNTQYEQLTKIGRTILKKIGSKK